MSKMVARGGVKKSTISAVITRADGRVQNLGVISAHHRNPVMNFLWQMRVKVNGILSHKHRAG
jgi:hypothetical protein